MSDASIELFLDPSINHNYSHANFLGRACDLAYLPPEEGSAQFEQQLGLTAELVSVDNTQAYVGENDSSIVVAFRGSESFLTLDGFKDWLLTNARNFLVLPEGEIGSDFAAAGVGARFHRGFMEALAEIWQPLFARVNSAFAQSERAVWITGHSLGGALALLCGWRFHQQFVPVHQICTFGAPMIGNDAAACAYEKEFSGRIFRYVDAGDLVPKLPTISLFSNAYQHCQQEIIVGKSTMADAAKVLKDVAQSVDGAVNSIVANTIWGELRKGMPSHMMGNYLSRLTDIS